MDKLWIDIEKYGTLKENLSIAIKVHLYPLAQYNPSVGASTKSHISLEATRDTLPQRQQICLKL